jgi:predicted ATPase
MTRVPPDLQPPPWLTQAGLAGNQMVMIVGEPGLGKSRLMEEFHSRLSDAPHTFDPD